MPDLNAVTNTLASAPQSFVQKDRAEELKDARQPVSQFDSRDLAQNDTVNTDQRAESSTTVFAANSASDSNVPRATATAASPLELSSEGATLQQTADAFEEQLQRANLERQNRPAPEAEEQVNTSNQQASRPTAESRPVAEETAPVANTEEAPQDVELPSPNEQAQSSEASQSQDRASTEAPDDVSIASESRAGNQSSELETPPERETAEDALGLS